eukprot:TRINITY_DN33220_c0_g1_i1.p2 TRINITY_DN33220_c0_g1~~TRINITY_DN33220_c0_g1_i1.p2  ORF type:complete len:105 (-),score=31.33 TRINITY_DN33220_c0_g1_i1:45-359(-)
MQRGLVGSEMCIRDSLMSALVGGRIGEVALFEKNGTVFRSSEMYTKNKVNETKLDDFLEAFYANKLKPFDIKAKVAELSKQKRDSSAKAFKKSPPTSSTQKTDL